LPKRPRDGIAIKEGEKTQSVEEGGRGGELGQREEHGGGCVVGLKGAINARGSLNGGGGGAGDHSEGMSEKR